MHNNILCSILSAGCIAFSYGWSSIPSTSSVTLRQHPVTSLSRMQQQQSSKTTRLYSFSLDDNDFDNSDFEEDDTNNNSNDDDFMSSLRNRMSQVETRSNILPLVVLDTMLPRQVLKLQVFNPTFLDLIRVRVADETPTFGMLGMARLSSGERVHLKYGVEVHMEGKPKVVKNPEDGKEGLKVELVAQRRFCIEGDVETNPLGGWTEATVKFLDSGAQEAEEENASIKTSSSSAKSSSLSSGKDDDDDEDKTATTATKSKDTDRLSLARAMSRARIFTSPNPSIKDNLNLVDRWISLAKQNERQPGQIDTLVEQLGEIPPADEPSERALWVGALINPIPAMGVAMEIRPALLTAKTAEERVNIALDGILKSIQHMDGTVRMW